MSPTSKFFAVDPVGTIFESENGVSDYIENGKKERRSLNRGSKRLPIRYFDPNEAASYRGILVNGCDGGAFIETNDTLPLLTKIRVEGPGIVFQAQVCRVHWFGAEERGEHMCGMAVRPLSGSSIVTDADYEDEDGLVLSLTAARALNR